MAAFTSPIAGPASWTLTFPGLLTVPAGLRYAGDRLPALRAQIATPGAQVRMPALGVLRSVTPAAGQPDAGRTFVEVQVNPFPIRRVAQAIPFGLPTFYLVFDIGSAPAAFVDGDTAIGDDPLGTVTGLSILCAGQDRVARDPALWSRQILDAVTAGGGTPSAWQPFADAVAAQTAGGAAAPVLLLDHAGRPRTNGSVEIVAGATTATATLTAADGGDIQRTVARMHAANAATMPLANLFGGGIGSVTLRPAPAGSSHIQLSRIEDGLAAATSIAVTPTQRHAAFTDLADWFAPQFATPAEPLARYTRGNLLTPLVNGPKYFDDLFRRLQDARAAAGNGGFHLTGWAMFPETEFTGRLPSDPSDLPITLKQAATLIGQAGGGTRFLPAQFFQLDPTSAVGPAEILTFSLIVMGLLMAKDVDITRSDVAGAIILAALYIVNAVVISMIIDAGGRPIEPNKDAVDVLSAITNAESFFAPFPARIEDNPLSPPLSGFPFDQLFTLMRNFGIYHQKFGIVRAGGSRFGYCGGIDLNPDRLDDILHLAKSPYHDVHARVEGPAVRDLELSFKERWARDGGGTQLAFEPAATGTLGTPGGDAVQVARTYFQAADPSRALPFAPAGDKTIEQTMIAAIEAATEFIYIEDQYFTPPATSPGNRYQNALLAKVTNREIRKLIITLPGIADQPFGELVRSGFISALKTADAGAGIVHLGYPRRHYTLPDNELRASSGRCVLMRPLAASGGVEPAVFLGPTDRLPDPPFWLAIDGELMYAYNESTIPSPSPEEMAVFQVLRGAETRLVKGGPVASAVGARTRSHATGAAATVVDLANIYVHAKMMIVDDVFVGIGSANLNRRGFFHDGEINVFSVPQSLKAVRTNPVAALRRRLWAEMLDLPLATVGPLLEDPLAAARLFERSPLLGNRYTDVDAYPTHLMLDATTGDGVVGAVLKLIVSGLVAVDHLKLYDAIVDPTSAVETA
jgi:phosphatidylserine/phosphatidylglycerophosphate/cardiolipin synthase-like enzyme